MNSTQSDGDRRRLERRESQTPGSRCIVQLDVALLSLPVLLEGVDVARMWLTDAGDGVYELHATQTMGVSRKQPGKPAPDLLVELVNELGEALDGDDVPQRLRDKWDEMVERYEAGSKKAA